MRRLIRVTEKEKKVRMAVREMGGNKGTRANSTSTRRKEIARPKINSQKKQPSKESHSSSLPTLRWRRTSISRPRTSIRRFPTKREDVVGVGDELGGVGRGRADEGDGEGLGFAASIKSAPSNRELSAQLSKTVARKGRGS